MSGQGSGPGRRFRLRGELAGQERRFPLPSGEVWIGSARSNDVVLPLRGVSRRHARLFVDADGAKLEDLDSKNGVAVNGTLVAQARLVDEASSRARSLRTCSRNPTPSISSIVKNHCSAFEDSS